MSDTEDRRRADLFEVELRRKAELDPGNCWELVWFLGLPLEVRCSYMRILEARIDQDSTRRFLVRQSCFHQRSWREPAVPCMFVQTVPQETRRPWASIGRRQNRRQIEYGRASNRRPRVKLTTSTAAAAAVAPASSAPSAPSATQNHPALIKRRCTRSSPRSTSVQATGSAPVPVPKIPPRPPTPDGLREVLRADQRLRCQALGFSPDTLDVRSRSPPVPVTPSEPVHYEPFPLSRPTELSETIIVGDKQVLGLLAYLAAAGRHHIAPWEKYTVRQAARAISELNTDCPGLLARLIKAFFPTADGLNDSTVAENVHINMDTILDFVRGLSIVPEGQMREIGRAHV